MIKISYSSKHFIDRPTYTKKFRKFLSDNKEKKDAKWIFYQFDAAEKSEEKGGIGKTMLIENYCNIINNEYNNHFHVVVPVIDFIEIKNRTSIAMWMTLVESVRKLSGADFTKYHQHVNAYFASNNILFLRAAVEEFYIVCTRISKAIGKKLVFVFDTFELIQDEVERLERVTLFPSKIIKESAIFIISSRRESNPSSDNWKNRKDEIETVGISGFTNDEAINFFLQNGIDLDDSKATIVNRDYVKKLNDSHRAQGRPILLALAIDYIKNKVVDSKDLLETDNFRERFIIHLNKFRTPLDNMIRLMAHVYHPWDLMMIKKFEKLWQISEDLKVDSKELFNKLRSLSFVRDVGINQIVLHDEMKELIIMYVWKNTDANYEEREEISEFAAKYYDEISKQKKNELEGLPKFSPQHIVANEEFKSLYAETWYHKLFYNYDKIFSSFLINEFTPSLDIGDLEQAELLMTTAAELNKRKKVLETDWNRIELRQLRIYLGRYYLEEAKNLGLQLLKKLEDQLENLKIGKEIFISEYGQIIRTSEGRIHKSIGNVAHYLAQVYYYNNNHKEAQENFKNANVHYELALQEEPDNFHTDLLLGRNINWQGYIKMQRGLFVDALEFFDRADNKLQEALIKLRQHKSSYERTDYLRQFLYTTEKEIKQWIAQVNGNKCSTIRNIGDFDKAENYGFAALQTRRKLKLPVEIVKSLNSLGLVYQKQHKFDKALDRYYEALSILSDISEPILQGRILTNIGTTLMCRDAFSEIFFFSNSKSLDDSIKRIERVYHPDHEKSIENLDEAIKILLSIGKPTVDLANVLFNTGEYYMYHKNWDKAVEFFDDAKDIAIKVNNFYYYYDILQRLLAVHYYSKKNVKLFQFVLNQIEESSKKEHAVDRYPVLLARILLLKGNFLLDAYSNNSELPIPNIAKKDAIIEAFRYYYEAAKLILPSSFALFNKIIELIDLHQSKEIGEDEYEKVVKEMFQWLETDSQNEELDKNFRLYFES